MDASSAISMKTKILFSFLTALIVVGGANAQANYATDMAHSEMSDDLNLCLVAASREGFPYYYRPEARRDCAKAKSTFENYSKISRNNRNLRCANQLSQISFLIWKTEFLGAQRTYNEIAEKVGTIKKVCYNFTS